MLGTLVELSSFQFLFGSTIAFWGKIPNLGVKDLGVSNSIYYCYENQISLTQAIHSSQEMTSDAALGVC